MSKTSASVSSGVPDTEKQMKARGRRPSAFIVSRWWNTRTRFWHITQKTRKVKLNQATRCLLRSFGQIYRLFSSIDLKCTCKQSRILAVHVSRSALQSRFTEQFFSTSRFTDTNNGRSRRYRFRACAKAIRYTVNIALIRSQYATSFKSSACVFFGRANVFARESGMLKL